MTSCRVTFTFLPLWSVFACCFVFRLNSGGPKSLCAPLRCLGAKSICVSINLSPLTAPPPSVIILNSTFRLSRTLLIRGLRFFFFWLLLKVFSHLTTRMKKIRTFSGFLQTFRTLFAFLSTSGLHQSFSHVQVRC